jgi:hypothetical protein
MYRYCRYSYGKEARTSSSSNFQKENPFIVCGQVYDRDVENVVHLFLQNSSIFPSLSQLNNEYSNSNISNSNRRHSSIITATRPAHNPGRIENLQSPIR